MQSYCLDDQQKTLIFLHIPKTAGTTLRRIIAKQYSSSTIYEIDGTRVKESMDRLRQLPDQDKKKLMVVKGHAPFGLHKYLPQQSTYITMLRDPVDRVISNYYYVIRTATHPFHHEVVSKRMTLGEYVKSRINITLDNYQVRMLSNIQEIEYGLCSDAMLSTAKRNLTQYFTVVGLTEKFNQSIVLMKRVFGWRMPFYVRQNVSRKRPLQESVSLDVLAAIREDNRFDTALYQFAVKHLEKISREQDRAFLIELLAYRVLNTIYQTRLTQALYRAKRSLNWCLADNELWS